MASSSFRFANRDACRVTDKRHHRRLADEEDRGYRTAPIVDDFVRKNRWTLALDVNNLDLHLIRSRGGSLTKAFWLSSGKQVRSDTGCCRWAGCQRKKL